MSSIKRQMCEGFKNEALNTKIGDQQFLSWKPKKEFVEFMKDFHHIDSIYRDSSKTWRIQGYFYTKEMPNIITDHFKNNSDCELKIDYTGEIDRPMVEVWSYIVKEELPF